MDKNVLEADEAEEDLQLLACLSFKAVPTY
jgi:hypothetical protein